MSYLGREWIFTKITYFTIVKFSKFLIRRHPKKTYQDTEVQLHTFLISALEGGE
jgi:hypothetical protein